MRRHVFAAAAVGCAALSLAGSALADVRITDQAYVRHDGGTDATIIDCNNLHGPDPMCPPAGDGRRREAATGSRTSRPLRSTRSTRCI